MNGRQSLNKGQKAVGSKVPIYEPASQDWAGDRVLRQISANNSHWNSVTKRKRKDSLQNPSTPPGRGGWEMVADISFSQFNPVAFIKSQFVFSAFQLLGHFVCK